MHDLRRKYHHDFPCYVASFISLFILVGLARLAAPRWVKLERPTHPTGGVGMTLDLEERNSVQDEGEKPPLNSDICESEPEHNRIFVRPR